MGYLTAAYSIIWLLLVSFVFYSSRKLTGLEKDVVKLQQMTKAAGEGPGRNG